MKIPGYVTELTREDWREIRAATRPQVGRGISIRKDGDTVTFAIDENEFKRMLWAFSHNGGFQAAYSELDDIPLDVS